MAKNSSQLWQLRKHGRPPAFKDAIELWKLAIKYFEWVEKNPWVEQKPFCSNGEIVMADIEKPRAMTVAGLCVFLNIGTSTWSDYKSKKGFSAVCADIEDVMREQKFSGAAAGAFNHAIIARDLGLVDKTDQTAKVDTTLEIKRTIVDPVKEDEVTD